MLAGSLELDHDVQDNINSAIVPCHAKLGDLKSGHYHQIAEISDNTEKCLEVEYKVSTLYGHDQSRGTTQNLDG